MLTPSSHKTPNNRAVYLNSLISSIIKLEGEEEMNKKKDSNILLKTKKISPFKLIQLANRFIFKIRRITPNFSTFGTLNIKDSWYKKDKTIDQVKTKNHYHKEDGET